MTLDEARIVLQKFIQPDGGLQALGHYMDYVPRGDKAREFTFMYGSNTITLDDSFNADELEAMAVYMRANP